MHSQNPRQDSNTDRLMQAIRDVLGKNNRHVADKLAGLWGSPACEVYLKALVSKRRDPDHAAARPFSVAELEFVSGLLNGLKAVHGEDAASVGRKRDAASHDTRSDFMVERRARPRPLPKGQVDVEEADTDSVWAAFNQYSDQEVRVAPARPQKYASVPEYPVNEQGHRLNPAGQVLASPASADPRRTGGERFVATQPLGLDAVSDADADERASSQTRAGSSPAQSEGDGLNFSFDNLNEPSKPADLAPVASFLQEAGGPAADAQRRAALIVIGKSHPKIASQITSVWGQADCLAYLQQLVFDGYDQTDGRNRSGFKSEVVSALMVLLALHPSE